MAGSGKAAILGLGTLLCSATIVGAAEEVPEYEPAPIVGTWYLRGDISLTGQQMEGGFGSVDLDGYRLESTGSGSFSPGEAVRIGAGYQPADWLRVELTGQFRGKTEVDGAGYYTEAGGDPASWDGTVAYSAKKKEWLFLASAYFDFGTWMGITPYAGSGIGLARITVSDFHQYLQPADQAYSGGSRSTTNLAWALHAGMGIELNERLTLDLGYSFLYLGDGTSGRLVPDGSSLQFDPVHLDSITSHDVNFGLRYKVF